jgi:DNA-binding NtrC family response regulator
MTDEDEREVRLKDLGFEEVSEEQRKENLANYEIAREVAATPHAIHAMKTKAVNFRQHIAEEAAKLFIPFPLNMTLAEVERDYTLEVLRLHKGNRTATADALGVSRRTLVTKLHAYIRDGASVCSAQ